MYQYYVCSDFSSIIFFLRYLLILFRDAPVEVWAMTKNPMMVLLPLPVFMQLWKEMTVDSRDEKFYELVLLRKSKALCYHIDCCNEQLVCAKRCSSR
jgi:hypothetical protein